MELQCRHRDCLRLHEIRVSQSLHKVDFFHYHEHYQFHFSHATPHLILFAGAIGGIVSKTAVYPLDLCKKRLQIQRFQNARTTYGEHFVCKGLYDCLSRTVAREGYRGKK